MGGEIHDRFPHQLASIKYLTAAGQEYVSCFIIIKVMMLVHQMKWDFWQRADLEVKASRLIPNAVGERRKTWKP